MIPSSINRHAGVAILATHVFVEQSSVPGQIGGGFAIPFRRSAAAIMLAMAYAAQSQKPADTKTADAKLTTVKLTEDLPSGAMQQKATTACTECHEARIILQQRLSKAAWGKEVDKMIKWGAVVDASNHDTLVDYLSANFSPDKPPYEPPRTENNSIVAKSR